jgi:hypothetical protein
MENGKGGRGEDRWFFMNGDSRGMARLLNPFTKRTASFWAELLSRREAKRQEILKSGKNSEKDI